jgi:hypothetical protein
MENDTGDDRLSMAKSSNDTNHRGRKLKRSQSYGGQAGVNVAGGDFNKSSSYIDLLAEMDGYCIVELLKKGEDQNNEHGDELGDASITSLMSEADDVGVGGKASISRRLTTSSAVSVVNVRESLERRSSTSQIDTSSQYSELVPPKKVTELWDLVAQGINITIGESKHNIYCTCFILMNQFTHTDV